MQGKVRSTFLKGMKEVRPVVPRTSVTCFCLFVKILYSIEHWTPGTMEKKRKRTGSGHSTKCARVQGVFGRCSKAHSGFFGAVLCVPSNAGYSMIL